MARGRKQDLSNVAPFPVNDDPQTVHYDQAKDLRPEDLLTPAELKVWDRVAPHLAKLGRLKPHFVDSLCEYCRVVRRLADARKNLDKKGWSYFVETRNGGQHKNYPEVAQLNDDWRKWRSLVGEFGLAPAAERGLSNGQSDLFDDFDSF